MKTIKPQKLGVLTHVFEARDEATLVVTVAAFFPLRERALIAEMVMWKVAAEELGKDAAIDLAMPKLRGELLITGHAYPRGGEKPACSVRARLGPIDKTLYVVGNRYWKGGAPSDPQPFSKIDVSYENAFGGQGYAENPVGKGAVPTQTDAGEVHFLPNVEDPKHLLRSPKERPPLPSGFGPYDLTWPQRNSKLGSQYGAEWLKDQYPGPALDFDPSFYNAAPNDQQVEGFFQGNETFTLENMHPSEPELSGALPGVAARVFVNRATDRFALEEIAMRADTVHLFPHIERGIVLFRGTLKVAEEDGSDVLHLVAGFESIDEPKPVTHYERVLAERMDREKGHLYVLRDIDLLPASMAIGARAIEGDEMTELLQSERLFEKNMRRRAELEIEKTRDVLRSQGLNPDEHIPAALPPEEPSPALEDLSTFVAQKEAQFDEAMADRDKQFAAAMADARKQCDEHGIDLDAHLEKAKNSGGGPPWVADAELARLREQKELVDRAGVQVPELDALLANPELEQKLRKAEAALIDLYRSFAHRMPPAPPIESGEADTRRARVLAALDTKVSLAEWDLTGTDLRHFDLSGADLRGAFLEHVNLENANLRGTDLSAAVLTRANLRGARLASAKLVGANLGGADLTDADVTGVGAEGAVFANANLTKARFDGADLSRADLADATFSETSFRDVKAPDLMLLKSDLRGASFSGADLHDGIFLNLGADDVDFDGANLSNAVFLKASGLRASFRRAVLEGLRVVEASTFDGASFAGAKMDRAYLRGTSLRGTDFSLAELRGADLSGADLSGANMRGAIATKALFVKTNLAQVNLSRSDLMEAVLQRAKLRGTNLEKANLFRADLMRVDVDEATNMKGANTKYVRFVEARGKREQG